VSPTDPEIQPAQIDDPPAPTAVLQEATQQLNTEPPQPIETRILLKVLLGPEGLRAGWSVLAFIIVLGLVAAIVGAIFFRLKLVSEKSDFTASATFFGELISFLAMVAAAAVVALIERRRGNILAYNLTGPSRVRRFFEGLLAGFAALSALIGGLALGGWLHFGPVALSGASILKYAAVWGAAFLLVGCVEEGIFRCFLQSTLTRGLNFWWALGIIGAVCLDLILLSKGNGVRGVYIFAGLGLIPCLLLHLKEAKGSSFWQAAWVASTLFGVVHTGNDGETWIGIFAVTAIGFVFAVSVRITGSAWWAIGCHAAWDWAETYFYGAADSGNVAHGHYLTTTHAGPVFWSGGSAGPEGSVLVLAAVLLLLVVLVAFYGRRQPAVFPESTSSQLAVG
jgi:membrane protease YdiL (CAAX protease family)